MGDGVRGRRTRPAIDGWSYIPQDGPETDDVPDCSPAYVRAQAVLEDKHHDASYQQQ
jgi:hypothetical protein